MERSAVFDTLKKYLESKMLTANELMTDVEINESTVLSLIGITSVEFVLLLVYVEDEFDITFEDDDLLMSNDITFGELIDKIMNLAE